MIMALDHGAPPIFELGWQCQACGRVVETDQIRYVVGRSNVLRCDDACCDGPLEPLDVGSPAEALAKEEGTER